MKKQLLNGLWKIENKDKQIGCIGQVPGSVIGNFVEQGLFEDPYYRTNEYDIREEMRYTYQFSRTFDIDESVYVQNHIDLVCYGIDTVAQIMLNGNLLGQVDNMHRTWRFDCKQYLKREHNTIAFLFESPINYIENYEAEEGKEITFVSSGVMSGNQYLRKAHSMFGWDWGAQLPDIGIWRDIELQAYKGIRLDEALIKQEHKQDEVVLKITVPVLGDLAQEKYTIRLQLEGEGCYIEEKLSLNQKVEHSFHITEPKLWWPNGYGEQPLYNLHIACLNQAQEVIEEKSYEIGLRTLTISQEKDEWGNEFAFCINGVKIFTKGANYIPEDCIYSRITDERMERLVNAAVRANYNCLRIWGGGYYPSDAFYRLCDRRGLIIWQDLMYACNIYDLTVPFEANIIEETYDNVKRLRHHACLGLWCGNNEVESAWENWGGFKDHSKCLKADYIKQFEYILPKAIEREDDVTFYWPSSPSSGGSFDNPDSPNKGDVHYWEVWHGQKSFSEFRKHYFRFCSEFGFQSFPSIKTIEDFTIQADRNIFSKVMESHQKNEAANGKILYYLSEQFLYPKDFESMVYISQILQGLAIKTGVEHWRNNRGRCMGALYWQMNDNWPVASWASIDYYGRWKPLHYMAKKFYAPLNGTLCKEDNRIIVYAQNETFNTEYVQVEMTLKNFDFKVLHHQVIEGKVGALSAVEIGNYDYTSLVKERVNQVFLECIFRFENKEEIVQVEVFCPYKHLELKKPTYSVKVIEEVIEYQVTIKSDTFAPFVQLEMSKLDGIFSDNTFDLTNKLGKTVELAKQDLWNGRCENATMLENIIIVKSLYDSYTD